MITLQWGIILATGLVPLVVGGVWYGPLFGNVWKKVAGMDDDKIKNANMGVIFGLTAVFGVFLAVGLTPLVIHQMSVFSTLQNAGVATEGTPAYMLAQDFMQQYGTEFRTLGHGALHGFMAGMMIALPVLGVNALFERKSWAYIFLNVGFWIVCTTILGAIICAYA